MNEKIIEQYIDINCDLGESISPEQWQNDAELMRYISSCNIACGGHAGNQQSMQTSVQNAKQHGLAIGAHPSYPDSKNFGRQSMNLSEKEIRKTVSEQIKSLDRIAISEGTKLHHVNPHGALYNDAAINLPLATIIAEEIAKHSNQLYFMGLAESEMYEAAKKVGLPYIHEGFMDRNYQNDKTLVPRSQYNATHQNLEQSLQQALKLAQGKTIQSVNNVSLNICVDSICLHGDNPNALNIAKQLKNHLVSHQIFLRAIGQ